MKINENRLWRWLELISFLANWGSNWLHWLIFTFFFNLHQFVTKNDKCQPATVNRHQQAASPRNRSAPVSHHLRYPVVIIIWVGRPIVFLESIGSLPVDPRASIGSRTQVTQGMHAQELVTWCMDISRWTRTCGGWRMSTWMGTWRSEGASAWGSIWQASQCICSLVAVN